ncbi:MAG: aspartate 1-decarboxylase [Pseudomonadota bacterium]
MTITMLKAKIHGACVTASEIDYEGSIAIDSSLLEMSGILPHEKVHVWNRTSGNRFETYAIPAPPGSGAIVVNGAAVHLAKRGDIVIVSAFAQLTDEEARSHHPAVVLVDDRNHGRIKP